MTLPAGILPPIVTPLVPSGEPDLASLDALVELVVAAGATGIVALGSTGECAALPPGVRGAVLHRVLERVAGRVPVIAGVPPVGSVMAAGEAASAARAGAAAVLVAAPAGTAWSDAELRMHFEHVAAHAAAPVIAYEVPSRVHVSLGVDLVASLAADGVIAAVKDSSGNLPRGRVLLETTRGIAGFRRYVGAEEAIDAALLMGYDGAVPGLSNVLPELHVALYRAACKKDWAAAAALQARILELRRIFEVPRPGGSFTAQAIGALKLGLVARGVLAHATLTPPHGGAEAEQRDPVARIVAAAMAEGLSV
jgi:4-hydroxy-tetrahydrodipicolinate synthase